MQNLEDGAWANNFLCNVRCNLHPPSPPAKPRCGERVNYGRYEEELVTGRVHRAYVGTV